MEETYEVKKRKLRYEINSFDMFEDIRSLKRAISLIDGILSLQNFTEEEKRVLMGKFYY